MNFRDDIHASIRGYLPPQQDPCPDLPYFSIRLVASDETPSDTILPFTRISPLCAQVQLRHFACANLKNTQTAGRVRSPVTYFMMLFLQWYDRLYLRLPRVDQNTISTHRYTQGIGRAIQIYSDMSRHEVESLTAAVMRFKPRLNCYLAQK